jgi:transmembrane sensor
MTRKDLLEKHFKDGLSQEESLLLLKYLETADTPEEKAQDRKIWDECRFGTYFTTGESRRLLLKVRDKLENEGGFLARPADLLSVWGKRAAVFAGLLIASVSLLFLLQSEERKEFTTSYQETRELQLPDGTKVILNANSSIRLYTGWGSETDTFQQGETTPPREVWLKGEAFFCVKPMENRQKFLVHTEDLDVEVLGTAFNVNSRRRKTKVVLNSGEVKLNTKDEARQELLMKPGELAEFSREAGKFIKENVDTKMYTSWKRKLLVFDDTPLHVIARTLEDIYGYEVNIPDAASGDILFSATVRSDDVKTLLTLLSRSCNVKIEKNGKTLVIKENS